MKTAKNLRIIIIQNRHEDAKFLEETIKSRYPEIKTVCFESILHGFSDIVHTKYDLILLDSDVNGFDNFAGIKLIKGFNDKVPIIVTCKEDNKFTGLKSVVEGADNYYIIRYDYQRMLCKILSVTLNLSSAVEFINNHQDSLPSEQSGKVTRLFAQNGSNF